MLYFTQGRNAQIGFHLDYNFDTPFGRTHAVDFREPLTWSRTQNDFGGAGPLNSGKKP